MNPILNMARHEWRMVWREPRFLLPFLATPLLLIAFQSAFAFAQADTGVDAYETSRSLLLVLGVLMPSLAVPLGADSFAGERERNSLEVLLFLPVSTRQLFLGKLLGIYPFPVAVGWFGQGILLVSLGAAGADLGAVTGEIIKALLLTPFMAFFLTTATVFMSLRSETVRAAAQSAGLLMLGTLFTTLLLSPFYFAFTAFTIGFLAVLAVAALLLAHMSLGRFTTLR